MATIADIDDKLIDKAVKAGNHKSKREAITAALKEYINYHKQLKVTESFGTIDYDPGYDYKQARKSS